jgi:hypothetical protein
VTSATRSATHLSAPDIRLVGPIGDNSIMPRTHRPLAAGTAPGPRSARPAFLQALADYAVAQGNFISLHTGNPGSTGTAEVPTATGLYARQPTTWPAATMNAGQAQCQGSDVTFTLPVTTVTHLGCWDSASGGNFCWGTALDSACTISTSGNTMVVQPVYVEASG